MSQIKFLDGIFIGVGIYCGYKIMYFSTNLGIKFCEYSYKWINKIFEPPNKDMKEIRHLANVLRNHDFDNDSDNEHFSGELLLNHDEPKC